MARELDLPDRPHAVADRPAPTDASAWRTASLPASPISGPLTAEQRERWLAWRCDPEDAPARVSRWTAHVKRPVERARVEAAVAASVNAHAALRTAYAPDGSGQTVLAPQAGSDLVQALPDDVAVDVSAAWITAEVTRRLESGEAPPLGFWWMPCEGGGRLVFAAHHVAIDAASALRVLGEIVAACRSGIVPSDSPETDPADAPMITLARTQQDPLEQEHTKEANAWWRSVLDRLPEPLDLPADKTRPAAPGWRGARITSEFSPETRRAVEDCAARLGSDRDAVLLAGWSALLHRLGGSEEFLLGIVLADSEARVGPMARVVPLRVRCPGAMRFDTLVRTLADSRERTRRFADVDLAALAREYPRPRDPARPWLSTSVARFEHGLAGIDDGTFADLRSEPSEHLDGDLALTVCDVQSGWNVELHYNVDVFEEATVRRWLGHFETLVREAAARPEEQVSRIALLRADERYDLVFARNPAPMPNLAGPALLHDAFERSAHRRPAHAAVAMAGRTLSYGELELRANRLAWHLASIGAGPERTVALVLDRSIEYAVATLAVLKAGAAFVPIDPEWPADRQELVVRDCGAVAVVTAGRALPAALPAGTVVVRLHELETELARLPGRAPAVPLDPDRAAYLIYTSGSTGLPKGVVVEHRAAAVHMASIAQVYQIGPDDCCLLFHSVAFDPAIEQLFAPWVAGATVHVRGDGLWTGREFSEWVRRECITAVTLPPLYFLQLLRDWEQEPELAPVGQLRRVLVGGEALPPALVDLWRKLGLTSIRLLNGYGPTECTVTATVHDVPVRPEPNEACGRIPIGRAQGPVEAYVLDEHLEPQPVGVPGELCLAGPTVARGYLGREALTTERFVPHPFGRAGRMYRTGDRARVLADGTIDFCGRADRQVKVGGYRVEPGEIEAVLGRCAGVSACAVVVETPRPGASELIGYIVPRDEPPFSEDRLREELGSTLPRYMIPARLFPIEALPRTINGKLDARALAAHGAAIRARESIRTEAGVGAAPERRDELAGRVAAAWADVLARPNPRDGDDFFLNGGHSLLAVALFARLEREFGVRLALSDWLAHATFADLVSLVRRATGGAEAVGEGRRWRFLFPIHEGGSQPPLFLFAGGRGCDEDFVVLAALTRALGPDQPVWGLRLGGPDRLEPTHVSVEDMARDVAHEIREFQPKGPYHLAGECIGGLLAYEVARVLERGGASVGFLGIINTGCPRLAEPFRWWLSTSWVGRAKQTIGPLIGQVRRSPLREAGTHLRAAVGRIVRPPHSGRASRSDGMPEDPKDYFYGHLLLRYKPTPTAIPLVLFGCETYKRAANLQRWSRHAVVRLVPLRGNSTTCIREHAVESAEQLRTELGRTASTPSSCA